MSLDRRGMFGKPRYTNLSKMVKMSSVDEARMSAEELLRHFSRLEQRKFKVATKRAAVLASSRARVMSNNKKISPMKRKEKAEIAEIFHDAYMSMELD
jgi:hypothetical protein